MKEGSPNLHNHIETWRMVIFAALIGLVFLLYIVRLFTLQVVEHENWVAQAYDNSLKEISEPSLRGIIYDRNGLVLARNVASYNVVITAAALPEDDGAKQEIYRQLSKEIGVPVNAGLLTTENPYVPCISDHGIAQIAEYGLTSTPYDPVRVLCDIDSVLARRLQEKAVDWPGVSVQIQPIRDYPTGELTANLVGFLGPIPANQEEAYKEKGLVPNRDKVGYAGLELQYQDLLAGRNGESVVQVDVGGQEVGLAQEPLAAIPGLNLRLTIDTRLQKASLEILKEEIEWWNQRVDPLRQMSSGVVVAMNPQTGEILAMVSWPTFENNRMARLIPAYYYNQLANDPTNPLLNHAVGDRLPVGSVFKIVTGTGALNEGVVTPDQMIETPPELVVTEKFFVNSQGIERRFVDWNPAGFGQLDFVHGVANSSNVYFYKLGGGYKEEVPEGVGICRLKSYAEAMGYGAAPGIGLPDEQSGLVPDPKWKRTTQGESWSTGDTYISSVGQGFVLGTPLQVLISAAIIANDGRYMQPTVVHDILDGEGNIVPIGGDLSADDLSALDPLRQINFEEISGLVSPFQPRLKWDITKEPLIQEFNETTARGCEPIPGSTKTVQPWVIQQLKEGMRLAVTEGTLKDAGFDELNNISVAGKTGTAEYCDKYALANNRCDFGKWPAHAWTVAFAPYENPEIAIVAFVYNGDEGSPVAGPIVRMVMQSYFEIKAMDIARQTP